MKSIAISALAVAFAIGTPAFAQSQDNASGSNQGSPAGSMSQESNAGSSNHAKALLTINKLKQDLQKAGFSDVRILADSFVVQAKDKDGNPTVMSLSPSGVFAISALSGGNQQREANARPSGKVSGPADSSNVSPTRGPAAGGEAGLPGLPGNKSGAAVKPSR